MYIHLGNEMVVSEKDIVGIFDLETTTISKHTRKFLEVSEKRKQVINVRKKKKKSFIITNKNNENKVYISQISTSTLQKRSKIL